MTAPAIIVPRRDDHTPGITAITNHEITTSPAHFVEQPMTEDEVAQGYASRPAYPAFVAEHPEHKTVLGFAHAYPWKARDAYRWSTEIGVYIHHDHRGKGLGRALYAALIPELERRGFRTILAGIVVPNEASVRLHESLGMARVATFPSIGFKMEGWRDVGYWAMHLGEGPPTRTP